MRTPSLNAQLRHAKRANKPAYLNAQLRRAERAAKNAEARAIAQAEHHRRRLADIEPTRKVLQSLFDAGTASLANAVERLFVLGICEREHAEDCIALSRVGECFAAIGADPAPETPEQTAVLAKVKASRDGIGCLDEAGQRIYDSIPWTIGGAK